MATTLAACGDVNRNVMAPPTPATSAVVDEIQEHAKEVSDALLPKTRAYHQIWVEGVELNLTEEDKNFVDPLYGKTYLPRKFKVAFAIPPLNDMDIYTNDLGYIAIIENGKLAGYNLLAGGGMGMSHGNAATFPRMADVIGFLTADKLVEASKAVVTIHRDFGDRTNRKHARLKYVIEEKGVEWFRAELESAPRFQTRSRPARLISPSKATFTAGTSNLMENGFSVCSWRTVGSRMSRITGSKPGWRRSSEKFQPGIAPHRLSKHFVGQRSGKLTRTGFQNFWPNMALRWKTRPASSVAHRSPAPLCRLAAFRFPNPSASCPKFCPRWRNSSPKLVCRMRKLFSA